MIEIKSAKKGESRHFSLSPSLVRVKLKLMFVGECATKTNFKMKFEDARAANNTLLFFVQCSCLTYHI